MFGRAKKSEVPLDEVPASVIPAEFYAGSSPVIHFPKSAGSNLASSTPSNARPAPAPNPASVTKQTQPGTTVPKNTSLLANRIFIVGGGVGLFVLFVTGASVYYWYTLNQGKLADTKNPPTIVISETSTVPVVTDTTASNTVATDVTPIQSTTTSLTLGGGSIVFPARTLGQTGDADNDGLTDEEEELFRTDVKLADTDRDSYADGVEIYNLYSPIDKAPTKLNTTNLVTLFTNPSFGYTLMYPTNWAQGMVNQDYSDMLFSTLTGESVEVRAISWQGTFASWFSVWAPSERSDELVSFTTREGLSGFKRPDNLVFYFPTATRVYVVVYNPGKDQTIYYPHVPSMIARSFTLPTQEVKENPRDVQVPQTEMMPPGVAAGSTSSAQIPL